MKQWTAIQTRLDDLEAIRPARAKAAQRQALALLTNAELDQVQEFAQSWDGDDAHVEAVYAAHPGTREAMERLEVLGQMFGVKWG
jgi:hypothetical protein